MLSSLEKHIDSTNSLEKNPHANVVDPSNMSYQEDSEDDDNDTSFEEDGMDAASFYQNTYFMDGDNRFISLPALGNSSSSKATTLISRLFEDWLEQKLYSKRPDDSLLPILEDNVDNMASEIVNQLKHGSLPRGISKVLVKVRTGHVYTYHQLEDGQPLITQDMEEFFQQFPLFIEVTIHATDDNFAPKSTHADQCMLLLAVENITVNPGNPYRLMDHIPFSIHA